MVIHVFIGSNDKWAACEPVLEYSIRKFASQPVQIHFMRPGGIGMRETGCTTFTNIRFAVPELGRAVGAKYGIYIDVDMLLLADIAELYAYRTKHRWAILRDGCNEVAVIDCAIQMPPIDELHNYNKDELRPPYYDIIPMCWNCEDEVKAGMKLLHFTDLSRQPWFTPERNDPATDVLRNMQRDCENQTGLTI